jgi:hypothetical protein
MSSALWRALKANAQCADHIDQHTEHVADDPHASHLAQYTERSAPCTEQVVQGLQEFSAEISAENSCEGPHRPSFAQRADTPPVATTFLSNREKDPATDFSRAGFSEKFSTAKKPRAIDANLQNHPGCRPKVFPPGFDLVDDGTPALAAIYATKQKGRTRIFASNADKQRAYRNRLKSRVEAMPPLHFA